MWGLSHLSGSVTSKPCLPGSLLSSRLFKRTGLICKVSAALGEGKKVVGLKRREWSQDFWGDLGVEEGILGISRRTNRSRCRSPLPSLSTDCTSTAPKPVALPTRGAFLSLPESEGAETAGQQLLQPGSIAAKHNCTAIVGKRCCHPWPDGSWE